MNTLEHQPLLLWSTQASQTYPAVNNWRCLVQTWGKYQSNIVHKVLQVLLTFLQFVNNTIDMRLWFPSFWSNSILPLIHSGGRLVAIWFVQKSPDAVATCIFYIVTPHKRQGQQLTCLFCAPPSTRLLLCSWCVGVEQKEMPALMWKRLM